MVSDCIDHGQVGRVRGYGAVHMWTETGNRKISAHRAIFEAVHGYRPDVVMHDCDNTRCINIAHLSPGTYALNNKDRAAKGRSAEHRRDLRRLSEDQVRQIRARSVLNTHKKGNPNSWSAIGRDFGVDYNTIRWIVTSRTYKDVI